MLGAAVVPTACKMVRADGSSEHVGQRLTTSASPLAELRADAHLLGLARAAALQAALPPWPTTPGRAPAVHEGKVGSSDVWTQQVEEIERQAALGTYCEEMEAHGVARACAAFGVPLLAIKDVANNELTPASLAEAQLVEMAVCPAGGQRPIRLPGPSGRLRPILRTPERGLSRLQACGGGLGRSAQAVPMSFPLSTNRRPRRAEASRSR